MFKPIISLASTACAAFVPVSLVRTAGGTRKVSAIPDENSTELRRKLTLRGKYLEWRPPK
jgi:hypothetical protein